MVLIHFSLPSRDRSADPERVDVVGGVLLAIALGLAVIGLYNPAPDGKQVLPSYGLPLVGGAVVAAIAFAVWERFARTRLIEPAGVRFVPVPVLAGHLDVRGRGSDGDAGQRRTVRAGRAGQGPDRGRIPVAALPDRAADRRPGRRLDRHQGRRPGGGRRRHADRRGRLLAGVEVGHRRAVGPPRPGPGVAAGVRHRPGAGRCRAGPGDRSADLGRAAGGARRPARHRVVAGGGGPDDRHADRRRGADRVGPVPVQPDHRDTARARAETACSPRSPAEAARYRTAFAMQYGSIFFIT